MNNEQTLDQRVIQLEELFTHQQHLVEELNGVIIDLRSELNALKQKIGEQERRMHSIVDSQRDNVDPREERPPHY